MAGAVVSLSVERLAFLLSEKPVLWRNAVKEVETLQSELQDLNCFLRDADEMIKPDENVCKWVSLIRDDVYDFEDLMDTFILKIERAGGGRVRRAIKTFSSIFTRFYYLYEISGQVERFRGRIRYMSPYSEDPSPRSQMRDPDGSARRIPRQLRVTHTHGEGEKVVGLEDSVRGLIDELKKEEDRLSVVSVVGMEGLGKTTLPREVYSHIDMKRHFDCLAWVTVTRQFSKREVLFGILRAVGSKEDRTTMKRMKPEELVTTLYNVLKEKRYFVVLDDIWRPEVWGRLKDAFPQGKKGSKVLLTTSNKYVASHADPLSTPVEPRLLTLEKSWDLLKQRACLDDVSFRPAHELLGKKMVEKCGGLPLAIVVLGGLLATRTSYEEWKVSLEEWEEILRNVHRDLSRAEYLQLAVSYHYHDLPFYLQPCFLYLSQFSEDREIDKKTLVRLWIAEGFVSQAEGMTLEDTAEQYLEDLINRSMIQVSQTDHTGIGVKTCRIHSVMRQMCESKAKELNFLHFIQRPEPQEGSDPKPQEASDVSKWRRIAIHAHGGEVFRLPFEGDSPLRALFYSVEQSACRMTRQQGILIFNKFKLLRVLYLWNVFLRVRRIPKELGDLIHLKYLGLRNTVLSKYSLLASTQQLYILPASIGNMKHLHTLDLGNSSVQLPDVLWKLEHLRHLLVGRHHRGRCRMDTLKNLVILKWVTAKNLTRKDAMLGLTNLRNLGIYFEAKEEVEKILQSPIFKSGNLRCLNLWIGEEGSFPNLEPLSYCHDLTKAKLYGEIQEFRYSEFPVNLHSLRYNLEFLPKSLAKLVLRYSQLKQDPMPILEKLPKLRSLSLDNDSYKGSKMVCSENGFPKLRTLKLHFLRKLEDWKIQSAMQNLETLYIEGLRNLQMIPEGLEFVVTLREVTLKGMPKEFERRVQVIDGVAGADMHKVRQAALNIIPSVR